MATQRKRVGTCFGACLLVVALLGACGSQADKQRHADAIRASVPTGPGQHIGGVMTLSTRTLKAPESSMGGVAESLSAQGGSFPSLGFVAERGASRAALLATPGQPPDFVATRSAYYARRPNTRPDERRPWVRVDLRRLNDDEAPTTKTLFDSTGRGWAAAVGPHVVLDLLAGVLPGSVRADTAKANGARSYKFNVSVDKANRELDLSEDERDQREYVLRSVAVKGDVFPGEATLRPDGKLARLRITFFQTPDRLTKIALASELRVEWAGGGGEVPLSAPVKKTTIRVRTMPELEATMTQNVDAAFLAAMASRGAP